jgi:hypothetical protein
VCVLCKFPEWTFGCLLQMKAFSALFCYKLYDPPRWALALLLIGGEHPTCRCYLPPTRLHTYHNINQSHHLFQLHKQNTLSMMIALVQRKKNSNHELQHKPNIPSTMTALCTKNWCQIWLNIQNLGAIIHHHHPFHCQNEWLYFSVLSYNSLD